MSGLKEPGVPVSYFNSGALLTADGSDDSLIKLVVPLMAMSYAFYVLLFVLLLAIAFVLQLPAFCIVHGDAI